MAQQFINIGTSANKGDGEPLRTAFDKINDNFTEVYGDIQALKSGAIVADVKGTIVGDDSTILVDGVNSSINLAGTVKGDIIPDANVTYDIGSATKRFKDLYLSGNTINLGGTALSITAGKLQVGGTDVGSTISFSELTNKPTTVAGYGITDAFDGDYNSLSNPPTIPTDVSQLADLTNILFDGDYNSLTNQPTIPTAYTDSDVNAHLNQGSAGNNEVLSWTGADYAWVAQSSGGITDLVSDTTPQLGGNLDLNGNQITTSDGAYIRGDDGTGHGLIFYSNNDFKFQAAGGDFTFSNGNVVGINSLAAGTLNNHTIPGGAAGTLALTSDIPAGYTDSNVDTHLNTSTAGNNEVLSWTGSDYDWVAQSGGGSLTGITDNTTGSVLTLNDTHIDTTRLDVQYIDNSYGQNSGPELEILTFDAFDINIKTSQFSSDNAFRIDATTGTDIRHTESSPRIQTQSYGTEFLNGVIKIPVLTIPPTSPADGMIAIADGSNWDPLSNGVKSMVVYLDSAWRQMAIANV